jgi:hypothetical protein
MKKFLILIVSLLISAVAVSAQAVTKGDHHRGGEEEKSAAAGSGKSKSRASLVVKLGPSTTYVKNGLSFEEVVKLLGQPVSVSERQDGSARLAAYTFVRSGGRVFVAEFADGVLVSSRTESYESLSQNSEQKQ